MWHPSGAQNGMYGWHVWNFTISRMACMDMYECSLSICCIEQKGQITIGIFWTAAGRPALQNWRRRIWMKLLLMHGCSETGARLQWNKWTSTKVAELEWSPGAQFHIISSYFIICQSPTIMSVTTLWGEWGKAEEEETQQGSQESGAKMDKIAGCLEICVQCWEHDLHISAPSNWEGTKVSECKR